jgi:hypothetical protein
VWCFRSWFCVCWVGSVLFALFFFGLIALFFWVFCCCRRVLRVALFLVSSVYIFSLVFSPELLWFCPLFIETHSVPLISPAFAGLYLPRARSWARDVVHDWNGCRFPGLRLNRDEGDHTTLPLATATFRPRETFSLFDPWTLEIRQLDP